LKIAEGIAPVTTRVLLPRRSFLGIPSIKWSRQKKAR
jgi:hypothetical protein